MVRPQEHQLMEPLLKVGKVGVKAQVKGAKEILRMIHITRKVDRNRMEMFEVPRMVHHARHLREN